MTRSTNTEEDDNDDDDGIQFYDIESMSHQILCMFCDFTITRKDGRSDSPGKGKLTPLSSFSPMVALSFLVSCCKLNPLHADCIYPLKYDQNYPKGSSAVWAPAKSLGDEQVYSSYLPFLN